jgi:hypothetical protein
MIVVAADMVARPSTDQPAGINVVFAGVVSAR